MTKKHRVRTNTEVLFELMNYSQHGALMQGYVMNAIEQYSRNLLASEKPDDWPEMLSWESWRGCAGEIVKALDKHFNRESSHVIEG